MPLGENSLGDREDRGWWRVNGYPIADEATEEIRTHKRLEVTFQVPKKILVEGCRPLQPDSGNFNVLDRSDGGYKTIDTVDGSNTHEIEPPTHRQDVRRQIEYLVDEYDETLLDQAGEKFEVELTLVPKESKRQYRGHIDEEPADTDWLFEFDAGDIATRDLSSEILETADSGVEMVGLDLFLDPDQTRKVEESARKLAAVRVKEQFDGPPQAEDNSPEKVNTVYIRPPAGGEENVERGYYVVAAWETERVADGAYQVALDCIRAPKVRRLGFGRYFGRNFGTGPEHESELDPL